MLKGNLPSKIIVFDFDRITIRGKEYPGSVYSTFLYEEIETMFVGPGTYKFFNNEEKKYTTEIELDKLKKQNVFSFFNSFKQVLFSLTFTHTFSYESFFSYFLPEVKNNDDENPGTFLDLYFGRLNLDSINYQFSYNLNKNDSNIFNLIANICKECNMCKVHILLHYKLYEDTGTYNEQIRTSLMQVEHEFISRNIDSFQKIFSSLRNDCQLLFITTGDITRCNEIFNKDNKALEGKFKN